MQVYILKKIAKTAFYSLFSFSLALPLTAADIVTPVISEPAIGAPLRVEMFSVIPTGTGIGAPIGYIILEDTEKGLRFTAHVTDLPQGNHGFHVHENPNCGLTMKDDEPVPGGGAGPHFDPENTQKHAGPMASNGHLGDLPVLNIGASGANTTWPILAPRLKIADIRQRSLIIHEHTDNYTDSPELGGSGPRIACGIIP